MKIRIFSNARRSGNGLLTCAAVIAFQLTCVGAPVDRVQAGKASKSSTTEKRSKQTSKYLKLKRDAFKKYNDPKEQAYKNRVDESFREKQREHGEYALMVNLNKETRPTITLSEDKLNVEDVLYDNPDAQAYVNRVGQSLIPQGSKHLYAFKVTLNPYPEARALTNGTIYVSTGMLALAQNEAQLAYILGHEIAHIEQSHWFDDVVIERYVRGKNEQQSTTRNIFRRASILAVRSFTGWFDIDSIVFRGYESFGAPSLSKIAYPRTPVTWDKVQEDEADRLAFEYLSARRYPLGEVKKFYAGLDAAAKHEASYSRGFATNPQRLTERIQALGVTETELIAKNGQSQEQIAYQFSKGRGEGKYLLAGSAAVRDLDKRPLKELNPKLSTAHAVRDEAAFKALLTRVRRDNGIRAFHYDLFRISRMHLAEAAKSGGNDPLVHYYYGRVMLQTARTDAERSDALASLQKAASLDGRRTIADLNMHLARAQQEAQVKAAPVASGSTAGASLAVQSLPRTKAPKKR